MQYRDSSVAVKNATVADAGSYALGYGEDPEDWVLFQISDDSTHVSLYVYCESSANRPPYLTKRESVNVQGEFTYYSSGNYWEIKVQSAENAPEAQDRVE